MSEQIELGCGGHFIHARDCLWRRHTQVKHYRISTAGNLYYSREPTTRQTLGWQPDSFFETMVFPISDAPADDSEGCGCREVVSWSELDRQHYATAGEAQAGHEAMVAKYLDMGPWTPKKEGDS